MVKCELRVTLARCIYFASYKLRVALIVRVTSGDLHLICELRVEQKLLVGNSKVRVENKLESCLISFKRICLPPIKRFF